MKLLIKELNRNLWGDLERLFGEKGAWGGCWCMYWRIEQGEKWAQVKGPAAKSRLKKMVLKDQCEVWLPMTEMNRSAGAHSVNEPISRGSIGLEP